MDQSPELSPQNPETNADLLKNQLPTSEYLNRLDEIDRSNLARIKILFGQRMQEMEKKGYLITVGGSLNKPLPRKDIDILVVIRPDQTRTQPAKFQTEIENATIDFETNFQPLVEALAKESDNFEIGEITKPAVDEEYGSPNILKSEGIIRMEPASGTPLEFIRHRDPQNLQDFAQGSNRNWVLLAAA